MEEARTLCPVNVSASVISPTVKEPGIRSSSRGHGRASKGRHLLLLDRIMGCWNQGCADTGNNRGNGTYSKDRHYATSGIAQSSDWA